MGDIHAVSGITVRPPEDRVHEPGIKYLCPKLVPGQVIEVPEGHNLLNQKGIERVRHPERDEFLRPWVFDNAQDAKMANPNKSRLGADAIASGLALTQGAQDHQANKLEARQRLQDEAGTPAAPSSEGQRSIEDRIAARRADPRFKQAEEAERIRLQEPPEQRYYGGEPEALDEEPEDDGSNYEPTTQNRLSPEELEDIKRQHKEAVGEETPEPETEEQPEEAAPVRRSRRSAGVKFGR